MAGRRRSVSTAERETPQPDPPKPDGPPPSLLQRLLWAAEEGDADTVRSAVSAKNVNSCDSEHGLSLLAWASTNGHAQTVAVLLRAGAATEVVDREGYTPLHRASWNGHSAVVRLLAEGGANLRATGRRDGSTALGLAASRGNLSLVRCFVEELKLGINEQDAQGLTPLAKAAGAGSIDVAEWLVAEGADSSLASVTGETARSICDRASERSRTRAQQSAYRQIITQLSQEKSLQSIAGVR
eukprot:TRINITY_DN12519_c0_g1_i1.p2 TRINITY_DN12519_c0_g1~~TRINITY_DN12519_c0_g1_i1.p2  ORF type:complete len:241 (+),score=77.26 TRINITY_DN12519_c0_g1_i1:41-763(+)